jgi:hypothetical protein
MAGYAFCGVKHIRPSLQKDVFLEKNVSKYRKATFCREGLASSRAKAAADLRIAAKQANAVSPSKIVSTTLTTRRELLKSQ